MIRKAYDVGVLVLAVLALCVGGAAASGKLVITSTSQVKAGAITSADLRKNAVRSSDVRNGAVRSADLSADSVTEEEVAPEAVDPEAVAFPEAVQVVEPAGQPSTASVGTAFSEVDPVTTYQKVDPSTELLVSWDGTAEAGFSPCVFQLRVDGQPSGQAGQAYVPNGSTEGASATATFEGLSPGPHSVSVYASSTVGGAEYPCTVGPASTPVGQTFTIQELVR